MSENKKPDESKHYAVGYRKPPQQSRFKKGQSGNPKGRPKGTLNLATVLGQTLREPVLINENGRQKVITKLEATVKQLVNKAASGDGHAMRYLLSLVMSAEEQTSQTSGASSSLSEADKKIMESVLKRFGSEKKGEASQ